MPRPILMPESDEGRGTTGRRRSPSSSFVFVSVVQRRKRPRRRLLQPRRGLDGLAGGGRVAGADVVAAAELVAVDPQGVGDGVHLLLVGETRLRAAEAAERAGERVIGKGGDRVDLHVVHAVRARRHHGGVQQHVGAQVRVRARIGDDLDPAGGDPAVPLHAGAVVDDVRVAFGVRQGRFLARVDHLHRPLGRLGQQRQVDLDGDVLLAAEAAADHGALDANLALRDADRAGDAAEVFDHLGGDADVEHAALIRPRHPGLRLDERVFLIRHPESVLDDQVRLGEARIHIPLADRPARHHVTQAGIGRVGQVLDGRARLAAPPADRRRPAGPRTRSQ